MMSPATVAFSPRYDGECRSVSSPDQMSFTACSKQLSSSRRSTVLPAVTAILSASLLGIGLAYGACTVLISAIDRSQDEICSGSDVSTPSKTARVDQ